MCSISGFYRADGQFLSQKKYYQPILDSMCQILTHRGPDDYGTKLYNSCGLAHTRLSIIDLISGGQPMSRYQGDNRFTIIYNGEIYNTVSLKDKLYTKGIIPQTTSDTEVLLLSYLTFGPEFIKDVDGIFAFAIFDEFHNELFLCRDPFGVKPLFYTMVGDTFVFSSELKGIFCYPNFKPVIKRKGLCEILGLGPARNPGNGILDGVYELLPGSYLTVTPHSKNEVIYYRLTGHPHTDSYEKTLEKTTYLVTDAIKRQMVSDVPICTFLSGGIDSSIVSAICAGELKKKGETLHTFSFDFVGNREYFKASRFQPSEDRPYVEKMVDYLHSKHTYLQCDNETQVSLLEASVNAHDLPCMADIDASLLYFCSEVAKTNKVVLTGECADEIFGGYPWFHKEEFLNAGTFPWTPSLEPRKVLMKKELLEQLRLDEYVNESYENAISKIDTMPWENETETNRRRISYLNIRYFMQTLLNRMDRTSMYSGLEARVPFADKTLVDYIFNTPWEMKAKDGLVKNLLRQSAKGILPEEILFRKKSPYPKTYHPEYEALLIKRLKTVLESGSPLLELFDMSSLNAFLSEKKNLGKPWYGQLMAGPQMIAYLLQIHIFLTKYHIKISI